MKKMTNGYYLSKLDYIERKINTYHKEAGTKSRVVFIPLYIITSIIFLYLLFPTPDLKYVLIVLLAFVAFGCILVGYRLDKNSKHFDERKTGATKILDEFFLAKEFDEERCEEEINKKLGIHLPIN